MSLVLLIPGIRRAALQPRLARGQELVTPLGGPRRRGGRRPFGAAEVDAMSGAQSISARRAYGVQRVCRVWGRARSSVYVRQHAPRSCASRRRGPVGAATDKVLVGHIRRVLEASPFHGEGYRKAWAKLRVERIRTSQERVRRLMREHGLQAPYRAGHAHGPKAHDGTITTAAPNVMWGTDMTSTATGSPMGCVCATTTARTTWLTISNRRSRSSGVRVPRASCERPKVMGVAERFIRTLQENLLWVRSFETIEDLRLALLAFKRTYNEQGMLAKYDYRSPAQVRRDFDGLDAAA